jgi:hypothetical protein
MRLLTTSNYFGPTIYKNLGFGGNTTLLINGVSGAWQVVVVWVFIQFIGKLLLNSSADIQWTASDVASPSSSDPSSWPSSSHGKPVSPPSSPSRGTPTSARG